MGVPSLLQTAAMALRPLESLSVTQAHTVKGLLWISRILFKFKRTKKIQRYDQLFKATLSKDSKRGFPTLKTGRISKIVNCLENTLFHESL